MEKDISSFLDSLTAGGQISSATAAAYGRDLRKFLAYLEKERVTGAEELCPNLIQGFTEDQIRQGVAAASVARSLSSVRGFCAFLTEKRALPADPAAGVHAPRAVPVRAEALSLDDLKKLMDQPPDNTPKGIRDRAMLELFYLTGMRISELISLQVGDVNVSAGYVRCGGRGREKIIPIGRPARAAVARYLEYSRPGLVRDPDQRLLFVNCSGGRMSRQGFYKFLQGYAREAGIKGGVSPHMLRHSFEAHLWQPDRG